jgi:hypothetical protein
MTWCTVKTHGQIYLSYYTGAQQNTGFYVEINLYWRYLTLIYNQKLRIKEVETTGRPRFDSWQGQGRFLWFRYRVQTDSETHSASCPMGTGGFPREQNDRSVRLTTHLYLVQHVKNARNSTSASSVEPKAIYNSSKR